MTARVSHRTIVTFIYALLATNSVVGQAPDSSASGLHMRPPISVLSVIPILATVDARPIRDELESALPTGHRERGMVWITGHRIGDCCHVQLGVHRSGAASLGYSDGALSWSVPLSINNGRVDWREKLLFLTIRHHEDFGGGFRVSGSTRVTLDSDWSVDAITTLDYSYTERPWMTIHVGPLKTTISIGGPVGMLIDKKIHVVQSAIDSRIEALIGGSIQPAINAVWEQTHQTLQVARQPSVWMQTRPAGVAFRGLSAAPDDTFFVSRSNRATRRPLRRRQTSRPASRPDSGEHRYVHGSPSGVSCPLADQRSRGDRSGGTGGGNDRWAAAKRDHRRDHRLHAS